MDIVIQNTIIGSIGFRQDPPTAQRTAEGFTITLPITVRLSPAQGRVPMLSEIYGTLFHADGGQLYEIGRFYNNDHWQGGKDDREFPANLEWRGTLAALANYERLRDGRPVSMQVWCAGQVHLLSFTPGQPLKLDFAPFRFHGQEQLRITTESWTNALRALGVIDLVLVHIPVPTCTSDLMTPVWTAVQTARDDFAAGGATGWRSCGIHIREALTDWEGIEKLDTGKGIQDKKVLTKSQRLDNLRYYLREFTHIAGHPDPAVAKTWTRDDALLALSTACALLNARKL